MALTKITQPCEILFRFDHERPNVLKGAHYCDRTIVLDDGVVISSIQNPAVPVSIAEGVKGLDLQALLGTLVLGQQAQLDEQAAAIEAHNKALAEKEVDAAVARAELEAKMEAELEASIQALLAQLDAKDAIIQQLMEQNAAIDP